MKKIIIASLVLAILLAVAGCGKKPEKTALQFFAAMEKNDFEAAKKLVTKDSEQLMTLAQTFMTQMTDEQKKEVGNKKYKILDTKVTGDSAVVSYEEWDQEKPEARSTKEMKMVKEDGDWKVKLDKESANK
jgi:predicted small lipoprotein YifL